MSNTFWGSNGVLDKAEYFCRFWTGIFEGLANACKTAGRSIEETARVVGMEMSEWMALEAGTLLPRTAAQLRAIAVALEMKYDVLASFVLLCWLAWES